MARTKTSSKGKRKTKQGDPTPQDRVAAAFMGCPRCSFFLVGYKLLHNDFDAAVQKSDGEWLVLSWDHAVKQLVHKSYGNQIEMDAYYFEGSCKECQRPFIFEAGELIVSDSEENGAARQPSTLRIAVKKTK